MPAIRLTLEAVNEMLTRTSDNVQCLRYNSMRKPSKLQCTSCSHIWLDTIREKNLCPKCRSHPNKMSNQEFISRMKNRPITPLDEYTTSHTKIRFSCDVCSHVWETVPYRVLGGTGCIKCANVKKANTMSLKYYDKPTTLYTIYFPKRKVFKTGITTRTIEERFRYEERFIIIQRRKYNTGMPAWNKEQLILKQHKKFKYKGENFMNSGGYHELYTNSF